VGVAETASASPSC